MNNDVTNILISPGPVVSVNMLSKLTANQTV